MSNSTQRALTREQLVKLRAAIDVEVQSARSDSRAVERLEDRLDVSIATLGRAALGLPVKEASARLIEAALERDK